jgi:8-oxo-dGTP pyrophosphatase MutT (NUDIX family)
MEREFSAGCILFRRVEGKIQLAFMLDRFGGWTFPKGHLEAQESAFAAARRELQEELGLIPSELITRLGKSFHYFRQEGREIRKQTEWFLVRAEEAAGLKRNDVSHVAAVAWVDLAEAGRRLGYPNLGPVLRRAKQVLISCYL